MKLVTLYLDKKRVTHVMDFTQRVQVPIREYVIEKTFDSVLFEFAAWENGSLGYVVENGEEIPLKLERDNNNNRTPNFQWNDETKELSIHLTTRRGDSYNIPSNFQSVPMGAVCLNRMSSNVVFKLNNNELDALRLTFVLDNVSHSIDIKFYSADKIYRSVVDFGSEASQALINCGGNVVANNVTELFNAVKATYANGGAVDIAGKNSTEFMQFDNGVVSAFKSIYYVAKEVDPTDVFENTWSIVGQNEKIFRAVTLRDQASVAALNKDFFRLSNTKIDSLGNAQVSSIKVGNLSLPVNQFRDGAIYRLAINCILSEVIKRVSELNSLAFDANTTCGLRLTVLMPNVYDTKMVADKLTTIRKDVHNMIVSEWKNVSGVEVSMVSESDASLLGAIEAKAIEPDAATNYLVLDCGKGTLDFSVLGYNPNTDHALYRSLCRGGIVGAGNALTYAVLYGMVHHFLHMCCSDFGTDNAQWESNVKQFIFNQIIKPGDSAKINEIILLAENFKKQYGVEIQANAEQVEKQRFENINYSDFADFVKAGGVGSNDIKPFVNAQINTIVDKVTTKLNKVLSPAIKAGVSSIVFTGRGFLMDCFRKEMFNQLKSKVFDNKDIKIVIPQNGANTREIDAKRLCLFITNQLNSGTYDGSLMNTAWAVRGVEKSVEDGFIDKKWSQFKRAIKRSMPLLFQNDANNNEGADISTTLEYTTMEFVHNAPIVNIGGVEYNLANAYRNLMYRRGCIFFDGSEFKLYVDEIGIGDVPLPRLALFGESLYYDSLFPYVTLSSADQLSTPTEPQVQAQPQSDSEVTDQPNQGTTEEQKNQLLVLLTEYWSIFANWMKKFVSK